MSNKYQARKSEIDSNLQLQEMLSNPQYVEIKEFLQSKYRQAKNTTFTKTASRLEKKKGGNNPRWKQQGARRGQQPHKPARQNQSKTDIKSLFVNLLKSL